MKRLTKLKILMSWTRKDWKAMTLPRFRTSLETLVCGVFGKLAKRSTSLKATSTAPPPMIIEVSLRRINERTREAWDWY